MANNPTGIGGAKPGEVRNPHGRPPKERETRFAEITLSSVTFKDWQEIAERAVKDAKKGDGMARKWLSDNLVGLPIPKNPLSAGSEKSINPLPTIPAELLAGPYFDVYRDIINHTYKEFPFGNGRGSLKSTFVGAWIIPLLLINNPNVHCLALRQKAKDLRSSVYGQISWGIGMLGLRDSFKFNVSPMEITYIPTGQKIYFSGADDPSSLKSIKPLFGYVGILWFEEFDQFRGEESIRNIVQSALRGGDLTWMFETWNTPKSTQSWVNQWALVPKEGRRPVHRCSYLDVPREWLGQTFIDEAEHLKLVNPKAYDHEYMGIATGTGGQVFDNLEIREITDEEIARFDRIYEGIDWGFSPDPFAWGRYHYDANQMIIYVLDEFVENRLRNEEAYAELVAKKNITPDQLIIADSSEDKSVQDFRAYGANIRGAEKGPGSVKYSYKWLQSRVKIVIDPRRAPHHAREFVNCEHEQMKDGTFIGEYPDKNNHCIDTMRYAHNLIWRVRGL
jgi:phage terminase large subunit